LIELSQKEIGHVGGGCGYIVTILVGSAVASISALVAAHCINRNINNKLIEFYGEESLR
jgi:hypothetical protein